MRRGSLLAAAAAAAGAPAAQSGWLLRTPAAAPTVRAFHVTAHDFGNATTVLFGGRGGNDLGDTWLWDGTTCTQATPATSPSTRLGAAMASDPVGQRSTLFGGFRGQTLSDTWDYDPGTLASWSAAAAGCAGTSGAPSLAPAAGSRPVLGQMFELEVGYGTTAGIVVVAVGASDQQWSGGPLPANLGPVGMPGCLLRSSTEYTAVVTLAGGSGLLGWSLPANAASAGLPFFAQALVLDPAANPLGAVLSNAGAGVVGTLRPGRRPRRGAARSDPGRGTGDPAATVTPTTPTRSAARHAPAPARLPMSDISNLARALGRVPSGLFIVTATTDSGPTGFLGSFVMQMGFEPPTVAVAIAKGRPHLDAIRAAGRFGVSIVDKQSSAVMGAFLKARPDGSTPFDEIAWSTTGNGAAVLDDALAWLDCRHASEHETGDHVVVFGTVEDGLQLRDGDPTTHVRRNGLQY